MELLRNTVPSVTFILPTNDTAVTGATWKRINDDEEGTVVVSAPVDGVVTGTIPYQQYDGEIVVSWTFSIPSSGTFTNDVYYEVVTPLLTDAELDEVFEDCEEEFSVTEKREIEKMVRHIIQTFTGQSFGKNVGSKKIRGTGEYSLALPERLISLDTIGGYHYSTGLSIISDGWYLVGPGTQFPPEIKADAYGINTATVPIVAPTVSSRSFLRGRVYTLNGQWGWNSVPEAIRQAAKLLVLEYAGDPTYRDKYLTSMTAADWRIQFESGAFAGTGNVRADQLISNYVVSRGWAVI